MCRLARRMREDSTARSAIRAASAMRPERLRDRRGWPIDKRYPLTWRTGRCCNVSDRRAQNAAASTASLPASVTIAIRPSGGVGWREFVEMICPTGEVEYFCKGDWTGGITLIRFNKFGFTRRLVRGCSRTRRFQPSLSAAGLAAKTQHRSRNSPRDHSAALRTGSSLASALARSGPNQA